MSRAIKQTMLLALLATVAIRTSASEQHCESASGEARVNCLREQLCPNARSDAALVGCYRRIAVLLAGAPPERALPGPPATATPTEMPQNTDLAPAHRELPVQPEAPGAVAVEAHDFGLPQKPVKKSKPDKATSVSGVIVLLEKQPAGTYLVGLDNGQLWEENEPSRAVLRPGQQVRVNKRLLGAYKLVPEKGRSTGVHRLRCDGENADPRCKRLLALLKGS